MCFTNSFGNLTELRKSKRKFFTVWKICHIDGETGLASTCYRGDIDRVWWKKGKTVVPHEIRKPLGNGDSCEAGLYFYISEDHLPVPMSTEVAIKAKVKPEDIIAVNFDATKLCCVAAHVLQAPNPDQTEMRLKFLRAAVVDARVTFKQRRDQIAAWEEDEPEEKEALQNMLDEMKELKK